MENISSKDHMTNEYVFKRKLWEKKAFKYWYINNHFESMFIEEPPDPLPEFEIKALVNFGTERVLAKINELEIGKGLKNLKESK